MLRLREREVNEGYREGFEREFERDEMEKKLKLAVFFWWLRVFGF
jgi:hypothetical protein